MTIGPFVLDSEYSGEIAVDPNTGTTVPDYYPAFQRIQAKTVVDGNVWPPLVEIGVSDTAKNSPDGAYWMFPPGGDYARFYTPIKIHSGTPASWGIKSPAFYFPYSRGFKICDPGTEPVLNQACSGSLDLFGIQLVGPGALDQDADPLLTEDRHGLFQTCGMRIRECLIRGFRGDGRHVIASTSVSLPVAGTNKIPAMTGHVVWARASTANGASVFVNDQEIKFSPNVHGTDMGQEAIQLLQKAFPASTGQFVQAYDLGAPRVWIDVAMPGRVYGVIVNGQTITITCPTRAQSPHAGSIAPQLIVALLTQAIAAVFPGVVDFDYQFESIGFAPGTKVGLMPGTEGTMSMPLFSVSARLPGESVKFCRYRTSPELRVEFAGNVNCNHVEDLRLMSNGRYGNYSRGGDDNETTNDRISCWWNNKGGLVDCGWFGGEYRDIYLEGSLAHPEDSFAAATATHNCSSFTGVPYTEGPDWSWINSGSIVEPSDFMNKAPMCRGAFVSYGTVSKRIDGAFVAGGETGVGGMVGDDDTDYTALVMVSPSGKTRWMRQSPDGRGARLPKTWELSPADTGNLTVIGVPEMDNMLEGPGFLEFPRGAIVGGGVDYLSSGDGSDVFKPAMLLDTKVIGGITCVLEGEVFPIFGIDPDGTVHYRHGPTHTSPPTGSRLLVVNVGGYYGQPIGVNGVWLSDQASIVDVATATVKLRGCTPTGPYPTAIGFSGVLIVARARGYSPTMPVKGTWGVCDVLWSFAAAASGGVGWTCTQGGTFGGPSPPQFRSFGST